MNLVMLTRVVRGHAGSKYDYSTSQYEVRPSLLYVWPGSRFDLVRGTALFKNTTYLYDDYFQKYKVVLAQVYILTVSHLQRRTGTVSY